MGRSRDVMLFSQLLGGDWVSITCIRTADPPRRPGSSISKRCHIILFHSPLPSPPACYNYETSFIFCFWQGGTTTQSEKEMLSLLQSLSVPGCIPPPIISGKKKKKKNFSYILQHFVPLFAFPLRSLSSSSPARLLPTLLIHGHWLKHVKGRRVYPLACRAASIKPPQLYRSKTWWNIFSSLMGMHPRSELREIFPPLSKIQ